MVPSISTWTPSRSSVGRIAPRSFGLHVVDRDVAARHGRQPDEAADLDVLRADPPLAAEEALDAVDAQDVRLDALDLRAERDEEAAEVLDVRLAGGVADHGLARRERGRHDRVLGCHHARLVEEDVLPPQAVGSELETRADIDVGAELLQGMDVRVEAPPPDHVAARRRDARPAEARKQRPGEQERRTDSGRELRVDLVRRDVRGVHAHLVLADPLGVGTESHDQRHHRLDVADPRDVVEHDRLAREQARGEDRQCRVLVAGRRDPAAQGHTALDHEGLGDHVCDGSLGHAEGLWYGSVGGYRQPCRPIGADGRTAEPRIPTVGIASDA